MTPTVSVCIPAYRAVRYIEATVASVLDQTLEDIEVIVVDDASPDGTADVVAGIADARVRLERNAENLGVEGNWNRAVAAAKGRYVKVLGHDDLLRPMALADQVTALESSPEVALVAGRRNVIDEEGRVLLSARGLRGLDGVIEGDRAVRATVRSGTNMFGEPVAVLLRRDLMERVGGFSGARPYMIDLDYWCRTLRLGPLCALPEVVGDFRVTRASLSAALVREQASQAVGLFRDLRCEQPEMVSAADLALGSVRAAALALGRAASYRLLARRGWR